MRPRVLFETFTLSPDSVVDRADPVVVPPVGLVLPQPIYGNLSLATGGPTDEDEQKQDDQEPNIKL